MDARSVPKVSPSEQNAVSTRQRQELLLELPIPGLVRFVLAVDGDGFCGRYGKRSCIEIINLLKAEIPVCQTQEIHCKQEKNDTAKE